MTTKLHEKRQVQNSMCSMILIFNKNREGSKELYQDVNNVFIGAILYLSPFGVYVYFPNFLYRHIQLL